MSPKLLRLSLVLVLLASVWAAQACVHRPDTAARVEQGCCWKKEGTTVTCAAPTLKKDCESGYTWVANKSCKDKECGAA